MTDNERELRRLKGFAYFWWWRGFTWLGCRVMPAGGSSGLRYRLGMGLIRLGALR